jgi:hypothetical protein
MTVIGFVPLSGPSRYETIAGRLQCDLPGSYLIAEDSQTGLLVAHLITRQQAYARFGAFLLSISPAPGGDAQSHNPR